MGDFSRSNMKMTFGENNKNDSSSKKDNKPNSNFIQEMNFNNNNNPQKIQACAPAPVYVNAPPKPRRSTNMIQPQTMMVTGKLCTR